jgi:hypothetical protein
MKDAEIVAGSRFLEGDRRGTRWTVKTITVVGAHARALIVKDLDPSARRLVPIEQLRDPAKYKRLR